MSDETQRGLIHGVIRSWSCVACTAINPSRGEEPKACYACQGTEFIVDEIPALYRKNAPADCDHQHMTEMGFCPDCGTTWALPPVESEG